MQPGEVLLGAAGQSMLGIDLVAGREYSEYMLEFMIYYNVIDVLLRIRF